MRKNVAPFYKANEPVKKLQNPSTEERRGSQGMETATPFEPEENVSYKNEPITSEESSSDMGHSSRYPAFQFIAADKSKEQRSSPDRLKEARQKSHFSRLRRRLSRVAIASIPFAIFLVGLIILSIGLFSYIEKESILSIFITSRDSARVTGLHEEQNVTEQNQTTQTTVKESATVPSETEGVLVVPFYYQGDQIGTIQIDSIELEIGVYQGDTEEQFQLGAGHYNNSFLPGQEGNIVLAAHRTNYFRDLEYVKVGDTISFETTYGNFDYTIRQIDILEKADFPTIVKDTEEEQLTLYTCYPFIYVGNAPNRYVIRCDLQGSELFT